MEEKGPYNASAFGPSASEDLLEVREDNLMKDHFRHVDKFLEFALPPEPTPLPRIIGREERMQKQKKGSGGSARLRARRRVGSAPARRTRGGEAAILLAASVLAARGHGVHSTATPWEDDPRSSLDNWHCARLPFGDTPDFGQGGMIYAAELDLDAPEAARVSIGKKAQRLQQMQHSQNLSPDFSMRTLRAIKSWELIGASAVVLDWIRNGYSWEYVTADEEERPLEGIPSAESFSAPRNGKDATGKYRAVASEMICGLLDGDNTEFCTRRPQMTLSVNAIPKNSLDAKGARKFRLIIDGRPTNRWIRKKGRSFRMETLGRMRNMFVPGSHLFTVDLTNSYAHMRVAEEHRDVLGFRWPASELTGYIEEYRSEHHGALPFIDEEGYVFMRYKVLPFGICSSPAVFTRLMRVVVRHIRKTMPGLKVLQYLDDFIFQAPPTASAGYLQKVRELFDSLGLKVNEKSDFSLSTSTEGLGFKIDNSSSTFSVTKEKRDRYLKNVVTLGSRAAAKQPTSIKSVARVAGQIMSLRIATGPRAQLFTRALFGDIGRAQRERGWGGSMRVGAEARRELTYWKHALEGEISSPIRDERVEAGSWPEEAFAARVEVDASDTHWGANIELTGEVGNDRQAIERFLQSEEHVSSTLRETFGLLRATEVLAESALPATDGETWRWIHFSTDNWGLSKVWEKGSRVAEITRALKQLDELLRRHRLRLFVQWVPREYNEWADWLSKAEKGDTLSFDHDAFRALEETLGLVHTVDAFAAYHNVLRDKEGARLPFFSRYGCRGTAGVNFFAQDLTGCGLLFVNAPFHEIGRVLDRLAGQRARATIICPGRYSRAHETEEWFGRLYGEATPRTHEVTLDGGSSIRKEGVLVSSRYPLAAVVVDFR